MKALVIGAAGFVGPYLCRNLLDNGFDVLATKLENENSKGEFKFVNLNILKKEEIDALLEEFAPDVIFHLAAQSSVKLSWEKPQLTFSINVIGAINLLESVKEFASNAKVVLIGSGEEYGQIDQSKLPVKEDAKIEANNFYAVSKATQNSIGRIYAKAYGLNVVSVRAFNHIGVGQLDTFVIPSFCKQVVEIEKTNKPGVIKVGNLSSKRDFTDVRDIVNAYRLVALKGKSGETYNVGSGHSYKIEDLLNIILSLTNASVKVEIDPARFRPVDTPEVRADISKLVKDTGYKVEHDLKDTIKEIMDSYR